MATSTRMLNAVISIQYEGQEAINQLNQSLTNTGQIANKTRGQLDEMGRTTGFLSQQFSIMRRSFEYAIAGMGLYKIYQAISAWKQYESQLGSLNATLGISYNALQNIGAAAMQVSNQTAQPLQTILQSFQNIAQTYPGILPANMAAFSKVEAMAANVLGAQPQDVGSTVGALATAFYSRKAAMNPITGPVLIGKIADMLVQAQKEAGLPNVTGEELLTAAQNLTGGAVIGRFSLPQALSYFSVIERQMASPSKASLYLRQLMARIVTPTTKEATFYSQAGLPSGQQLAGMTGNQIIQQLVKAVINQGANMTFQQALNAGFKNIRLSGAGKQLLEEAIGGRLQSGIAANLIVQGFGELGFGKKPGLLELFGGANTQDLTKRNQYFLALNRLQQASVEFSNLSTSLLNDLNPIIQRTAQYAGQVAGFMLTANQKLNKWSGEFDKFLGGLPVIGRLTRGLPVGGILEALGIGGGAYGLYRMLFSQKLMGFVLDTLKLGKLLGPKIGEEEAAGAVEQRAGPEFMKFIRAPIDVKELEAALAGKADGTPMNPFWVVIAPLSMQTVPSMFGGKPGSKLSTFEQIAGKLGTVFNIGQKVATTGVVADVLTKGGVRRILSKGGGWFGDLLGGVKSVVEDVGTEVPGFGAEALRKIKPYNWFKKPTDLFTEVIDNIDQEAGELFHYGGGRLSNLEKLAKRAGGGVLDQLNENVLKEFEAGLAEAAKSPSFFEKLPRFGAKGFRDNALIQILWDLAFPQGTNAALKAPRGMGDLISGDYGQFVPKNSIAWLAFHPNLVPGAGFGSPLFTRMARVANSPAVQKALSQFTQQRMSLAQFNRFLQTAELAQGVKYFATSTNTGLGVVLPQEVQGTFLLVPTAELTALIKPQKIRTAVPLKYVNTNAPAPTTRGKKVGRRL